VTGTVRDGGSDVSLEDFLQANGSLIKVCDSDNDGVQINVSPVWEGDEKPFKWVWILKETGDTLHYDDIARIADGHFIIKAENIQIKPSLSNVYEGIIKVKTDCECTDSLEIPFKIYKNFDLVLTDDVVNGKLCLPNVGDSVVTLTATLTPTVTDPIYYYWYKIAQDETISGLDGVSNPVTGNHINVQQQTISSNGWYKYRVEALDGVCYSSLSADATANADSVSFVAGKEMKVEILTPDTTICSGDGILFRALITNPRTDSTYTWSVNNTVMESGLIPGEYVTYLYENIPVTAGEKMFISINDGICTTELQQDSVEYVVLAGVENLDLTPLNSIVCLNTNNDVAVTLTATATGVEEYIWYRKSNIADEYVEVSRGAANSTYNVNRQSLTEGLNYFKVEAVGCSDNDVHFIETTIETLKPMDISIILPAADTTICTGGDIEFKAEITNPRTGILYSWYVNGIENPSVTGDTYLLTNIQVSGFVTVSITDAVCTPPNEARRNYTVYVPVGKPTLTTPVNPVCSSNPSATLTANVTGDVDRYVWYSVDEGGFKTLLGSTTANTYSATLTQGNNRFMVEVFGKCSDTDQDESDVLTIDVYAPITLAIHGVNDVCEGQDLLSITAHITSPLRGNEASYVYTWVHTGGGTGTGSVTNAYEISDIRSAGSIKVSVLDAVCGGNAEAERSYDVTNELETPTPVDTVICQGLDVTVDVGTGGATNYEWFDSNNNRLYNGSLSQYTIQASSLQQGINTYRVVFTGCSPAETAETTVTVDVKAPVQLALSSNPSNLQFCAMTNPLVDFTVTPTNLNGRNLIYHWELINDVSGIVTDLGTTTTLTKQVTLGVGTSGFVKVSAIDGICTNNSPEDDLYYKIGEGIQIVLEAFSERDESRLITDFDVVICDAIYLKARPADGENADGYTWSWADCNLCEPLHYRSVILASGDNTFSVSASKDGCVSEAFLTIRGDAEFSVEIKEEGAGGALIDLGGSKFMCGIQPLNLKAVITSNGSVTITDYVWSPANLPQGNASITYTPSAIGEETIEVTAIAGLVGETGCRRSATLDLFIVEQFAIERITDATLPICESEAMEIPLEVRITAGSPDAVHWWVGGELISINPVVEGDIQTQYVTVSTNQSEYSVFVTGAVCPPSNAVDIEILFTEKPKIELRATPSVVEIGGSTQLEAVIIPEAIGDFYLWSNDKNSSWEHETQINVTSFNQFENDGPVRFTVKSQVGVCELDTFTIVEVVSLIPNIFTPYSENGSNSVFMQKEGYTLEIYNRYQQMIFTGKEGEGWDGMYRGKLAEPGTYFYRIRTISGKVLRGTVELAKF